VAAHAFRPLHHPLTSAIGAGIITAGHRWGWPVAAGGSGSITAALAALLADLGGKIETGTPIRAASQLPSADVTLFDLSPGAVASILGDELPSRVARAFRRFRRAPGAFKVDFAVQGGVPWANPAVGRSGTVHLGGSYAEVAAAERAVNAGRMPDRPFVLIGQQYLAGRQHPPGVQLRARAARLRRRRDRGDHRADRAVRSGVPGADRRPRVLRPGVVRRRQPELRRR
jgi:phytoene dehydrogenase-like protein